MTAQPDGNKAELRQGFDVHRQPGDHEVNCLITGCEGLVGSS